MEFSHIDRARTDFWDEDNLSLSLFRGPADSGSCNGVDKGVFFGQVDPRLGGMMLEL